MEIETKVMIRLSKRLLIVAALLVLVAGSSAAVVPVLAANDSRIVYVAICVDSEMWDGFSSYIGSTNPHPTLNVKEYSRTVPMTVAAVFNSDFRNSHRDSFGNIFKMSWFAEMDYFMAQSNFVWADGSSAGVSGYTAIRDLLVNNWGTEIQTYGDSIEYHHHFMIYDGTWKRYDSGPDAGYPGYHMYALDHMIIDRNFYPSTWRSGWWIMPPALSSWLEQWMPFDYTPETGIWYPVHPSGMSRWQTKCPYAPNVPTSVNSAFAYASQYGSAVFSLCTHDKENMKSQVDWLQYCLNTADANEATYPNVSFKYVSAREAMQRALGFTDFTPPTFTVTSSDSTYIIVSSEPLWKNHPYIALKYTDGTYGHISATPTGTNTWTLTPPASASVIGVAGSDLYGNPGTATFIQGQYTLTVDTVGSGSVTKSPDQATYASGTVVTLTAVPSAGWSFSAWSGDVSGSVNPTTITMNSNKAVTATFTQLQYTLTVSVSPVGGGSVSRNNTGPYHYGDVVQLTASHATGWSFSSWSGALTGSVNPADLTITGNMAVTATFTQNAYTLIVTTSGSGSVVLNNTGPYRYGDTVQLTANPTVGWSFDHWSGDLVGSVNPTTILMDGNKAVTATFIQVQYTLTVMTVGSGSVSLNNTEPYHYGDVVQLTATPSAGWSFTGWSGDLTGSQNPTTIMIDGHKSVTATFTQNEYTLTTANVGSGSVIKTPDQATYHYGDLVQLTAVPALGWSFAGWSGDLSGSTNPETIIITSNMSITAHFSQNQYTLIVNIEGSGSVDKVPDQATYDYGTLVTLTAIANAGWSFGSWSGDLSGSNNPATIVMNGNKAVTATFTQIEYSLTVYASPNEGGFVTKSPDYAHYHYNDVVQLTAAASAGWSFTGWSTGFSGNPTSVTITTDTVVTAYFTQNEYTLDVSIVGSGSVSKSPDQPTYHLNDLVELTATADLGWSFSGWSGGLTGNPTYVTITGSMEITATFTQNVYTLTVTTIGSGTVDMNNSGPYYYGDIVELTASPEVGWYFSYWSGDLLGSANPSSILINGNMAVTATFTQDVYSITASVIGVGGTIDPSGVVLVVAGGSQSFTIEADPGYVIADVLVDSVSQGAVSEYTFNAVTMDHSIVASFIQGTYIITASVDGVGGTIDPSGVVSVNGGEDITFIMTPDSGYHVLNVMVDGTYMGPQNSFTFYEVDRDHTITAIFAKNEYTLTIVIVGAGSVTTNPNKISYSYGDIVELTAIPNNKNWQFAFWSGDLTGSTNPATIIMDSSKTVTATFTKKTKQANLPASSQIAISLGSVPPQEYSLTVSTVGNGSVGKVPDQASYHLGDVITLTAAPTAGLSLSALSGDISSSLNPIFVTINGTTSVTATFTQIAYKLTFTVGAAQSVIAGALSLVITVQRQDQYGNPVASGSTTVSLISASRKDVFYSDAGTTKVTSVVIKDGSSTVDIW